MTEEVHISSLVVHSTPARMGAVSQAISALPGAQVHASAPNGKLVITLETGSADDMLSLVQQIQHTDGVMSAALVYQFADSAQSMNEEIPDAH